MALEWESVEIRCRHCDGTGVAFFPPGWYCQFCGGTGKMCVVRLVVTDTVGRVETWASPKSQ